MMYENPEQYPYHFEPIGSGESEHNFTAQTPPQAPVSHPKKSKTGLRVVALALSCAIVGGVGGGAMVYAVGGNRAASAAPVMSQTTAEQPQTDAGSGYGEVAAKTGPKAQTPKAVYNANVNSVVGITTAGISNYGEFSASGSGFVISADGYIVTNHHVIDGADTIKVALYDGTTYDAALIGSDASNDVALLKVEATALQSVTIGDSAKLEVGDQVAAIGNPLGKLTFSLTAGYVSALDRTVNTEGTPINMLQTDVAINAGNSGGPLFDMDGNVVGITTAKYSGNTNSGSSIEGIGFAIPINDVMSIVNDLQVYGYVTGQAYLGVSVKDLDANTASDYSLPLGVFVAAVTDGGCAQKAGIQQGDIITKLHESKVETYADLTVALKKFKAGESTTITVYRAGQTLTLDITFDERQPESQEKQQPAVQQPVQPSAPRSPFGDFFGFNW